MCVLLEVMDIAEDTLGDRLYDFGGVPGRPDLSMRHY